MRQNLPAVIILSALWAVLSAACFHLAPEGGWFGAVGAGFILTLLLGLPVTLATAFVARLFIR